MRRSRLSAAALLLLVASCGPPVEERPNVILLLVDTLRADHLGASGFPADVSPNLDRIAAESVLFENCFAHAPWTPPSIATLFTSLYPQVHGLNRFIDRRFVDPQSGELRTEVLPEDAVTLAEAFSRAGFDTAAFVANPWLDRVRGLAQGFDTYDDGMLGNRVPATVLMASAHDWLGGRRSTRPFFMYLHLMDVHEPYDAPREDFDALWPALAPATERLLAEGDLPPPSMEVPATWADNRLRARLAYWRTRYASGVHAFDRRIAEFLDDLRDSGVLDRSYLIVTADHGEELFEHSHWGHGDGLCDHQLRVPLLVRPPGGLPGTRRIADTFRLVDLMPTLLSLARGSPPLGMQGTDRSALLLGQGTGGAALVFATGVVGEPGLHAIRTHRYKLVVDLAADRCVLYDLAHDPQEVDDASLGEAGVVAELRAQLEQHLVSSAAFGLTPGATAMPEKLRERLEALGYLD